MNVDAAQVIEEEHKVKQDKLEEQEKHTKTKKLRMLGVVREMVSKEKRRYQLDGFDLGMCCAQVSNCLLIFFPFISCFCV
jgi:hypothetical protein